jgi:peptide/nickel transport system substrate-binding protein
MVAAQTLLPDRLGACLLSIVLLVACGPQAQPAGRPSEAGQPVQAEPRSGPKILTMAISAPPSAFSLPSASVPAGGWVQFTELHSDGLVTSEAGSRRLIGRLAEKVPTVEDGSISFLPDGRMRLVYPLRKNVRWHDGTPFTAHDMVFAFQVGGPGGVPSGFNEPLRRMDSVEAPDDWTVVITYKAPYYLATHLGPHAFWPLPRHLLSEAWDRYQETRSLDDLVSHRYWTSEYVHLGPFRVTSFDADQRISFEAFGDYFLGRPKIDVIHLQIISSQNTILANLLSGAVHIAPASALVADTGAEAKRLWDGSGQGTVHVKESSVRLVEPQWRPWLQVEATTFDPRVRQAFYHALNREELAELLSASRESVAWSILSKDDPLYPAARDALRHYTYDVARARALLAEVGWSPGPDGLLRHSSDGRIFRTILWGTPGRDQEMNVYAAYWRALGVEVEEYMTPPSRYRDREGRAQFPGWDFTGSGIIEMMGQPAAAPDNRWTANNNGYDNLAARRLVDSLETTMIERDQLQSMKAISDFIVAELPALPVFFLVQYTAVSRNVKAFDDLAGADGSERRYGGYARNAYLWDLQ